MKSLLIILSFVFFQMANAAEGTPGVVTFINKSTLNLRDSSLKNPQPIQRDSEISIDPKYLKEHLGSETPSLEQIEQLMLNPTEVSKTIVTQSAPDARTGKAFSDYFFPVIVKDKSGKLSNGTMALQAYNRDGLVNIIGDGDQATTSATKRRLQILREQTVAATESDTTGPCPKCQAAASHERAAKMAAAIDQAARASSNSLFAKYQNFAREFTASEGKITRNNASTKKRLFVKTMVEKLGAEDAGSILAALTAFGEAPYRKNSSTQIGEIAALLKVIQNRARANLRSNSRTLRDIGLSNSLNSTMTTVLADSQFSVWNDFDNNLARTLNFNPDKADESTNRKMTLAFEAQRMMQNDQIEFLGKMNADNLFHYHANYVAPDWARSSRRVEAPIIRIKRIDESGTAESVDVNLQSQKGVRHIFYTGIS